MPRPADLHSDTAPATGLTSTPGDYGFTTGERVGRHVVLERVGGGGMGVVYAAYDPKLDRRVALKLLRPDATGSADAQQQLLREAQTLARLAHPNVVNVHDVGEFEGRVFVEMEFVVGLTLAEWLAAESRGWQSVLDVFVQAGRGLAAAHAVGIVHRDFKPDNVLVGDDGRVRVADFGIALLGTELPAGEDGGPLVAEPLAQAESPAPVVRAVAYSGPRVGTPAYMAPEQRSVGRADARSDQYSFCLALYEALHGARPSSPSDVTLTQPRDRKVPAWLDQALARGLSIARDARYPSMETLLEALESGPQRMQRRWARAAGVACLLLLGASGWAALRSHQQGRALLCSGAQREMGGVWGDSQKRGIEGAFARTNLPFAARAAEQAELALDRYAQEWMAMHTEACEATRVRGEQSDVVMDKRMQCLDRRLAEARTLAEIFESADSRIVERAVQASQALSPISDCSAARVRGTLGTAVERAAKAPPPIVEALGRASALDAAGKYEETARVAEGALEGARASNQVSLEAQALELIGKAANQEGDGPRAEHLLFDAFVAAERSGADGVASKAALESGFSIGYLQNRGEEAEKWFRLASVAIDRMGGDDHRNVELLYARSAVAWSSGKFKDSIDDARLALRLSEEKLPGDTLQRAYCLTGLGVSLMSQGQTQEARGFLEQALVLDEQVLGPDHPNVEMDALNLATLAKAEGRYADAVVLSERTVAIGRKAAEPDGAIVALALGELGEAHMRLGRYDEARDDLARALSVAEASSMVERSRVADLYATRGKLARVTGSYPDARKDLEHAIAISTEAVGKDNPEAADALLGLARVDLETGRSQEALPLLERVLVLDHDLDASELAEPRLALAQALWQTRGDRDRAAELARQARAFYERLPARRAEVQEIEAWFKRNGGP